MGSKRRKPEKTASTVMRNPVARNPLLGKGGEHKDARAGRKQSRAKARRDIKNMHKQMQQSGEGSWQSSSMSELLRQLPSPALAQFGNIPMAPMANIVV